MTLANNTIHGNERSLHVRRKLYETTIAAFFEKAKSLASYKLGEGYYDVAMNPTNKVRDFLDEESVRQIQSNAPDGFVSLRIDTDGITEILSKV